MPVCIFPGHEANGLSKVREDLVAYLDIAAVKRPDAAALRPDDFAQAYILDNMIFIVYTKYITH